MKQFNEDNMDKYFQHFDKVAMNLGWPVETLECTKYSEVGCSLNIRTHTGGIQEKIYQILKERQAGRLT